MKSTNFEIQPLTIVDLEQVVNLANSAGLGVWKKADYETELLNPFSQMLVAVDSNKIIGFIAARLITPIVEILNIAVLTQDRRLGVGAALLNKVLQNVKAQDFKESWLEVRESNNSAQKFYLAHNFKIVGRRKNYYSNPIENAILMTLHFSDNHPKK